MKVYLVNMSGHTLYVKGSKGTSWSGTVKAQEMPGGNATMYEVGTLDTPSSGQNWGWIYLSITPDWAPLLQLFVLNNSSGAKDYAVQYFDEGENPSGDTILPSKAEMYGDAVKLTVQPLQVSWMNKISSASPGKMLHQITIPGTHDSGTYELFSPSRCQSMTIEEQLLCGVRYFDIRVDASVSSYRVVHGGLHGSGNTNYYLEGVSAIFRRFLAATRETLVMQLNADRGTPDPAGFLGAIRKGFPGDDASRLYLEPIRRGFSLIPTLEQLLGRMLLVRRYGEASPDSDSGATPVDEFATGTEYTQDSWSMPTNPNNWNKAKKYTWPDGAKGHPGDNLGELGRTTFAGSDFRNRHGLSFFIQDKYSIGDLDNVPGKSVSEVKFDLVKKYLEAARTGQSPDSWFLNFSSGSELLQNPLYYAALINEMLKAYFKLGPRPTHANCGFGTIMMDLVDRELLDLVIGLN